jgi:hypothetical protein
MKTVQTSYFQIDGSYDKKTVSIDCVLQEIRQALERIQRDSDKRKRYIKVGVHIGIVTTK